MTRLDGIIIIIIIVIPWSALGSSRQRPLPYQSHLMAAEPIGFRRFREKYDVPAGKARGEWKLIEKK